jgi:predicted acylesterase/phospholipase RssA
MIIPPKRIVLTGGGLRTLAHYGALEVLESKGLLKNVKEWIGVSAGALIGFSLMIGYTLEEAKKVVTEFDFSVLQNAHPELVLHFFTTYGIDTGERLEAFLQSLLRIRGHPHDITFREWSIKYPTAPTLRCYACNLNTTKIKEFSLEKTPDTSLVFAMRASMSLPLYFVPVKDPETGHLFVDGGTIQNYPMNYLTAEERSSAIGISFLYSQKKEEQIEEFSDFLNQIYNSSFNPRTYQVQQDNKLQTILIKSQTMSAYNFDLTKEFREAQIDLGRKAALDFCKDYLKLLEKHNKPVRRFSVS